MPLALPKSLVAYCSWSSLPACIMVNSICQTIFVKILVMNILSILIQHVCECTQTSINPSKLSFWLKHHFWTWACSRPFCSPSIVPLGLLNLSTLDQSVCFWSFDLEIIIPLISKHRIIQMFYNLMPLHPFFNWLYADAHISSAMDRQILYWIIIRQCPP